MPPATSLGYAISSLCSLESPLNSILPSIQHIHHLFFPAKIDMDIPIAGCLGHLLALRVLIPRLPFS